MELEEREFTIPPVDGDVTIRQPVSTRRVDKETHDLSLFMGKAIEAYTPLFEAVVRDLGGVAEILSGDLYD